MIPCADKVDWKKGIYATAIRSDKGFVDSDDGVDAGKEFPLVASPHAGDDAREEKGSFLIII